MGVPYSLLGRSFAKRQRENSDDEDDGESNITPPVRKKLKTAEYIYQQLFLNGSGSDITVYALGKEWNLHKIYLSQSPYFSTMFNGSWKEARQSSIYMSVPNNVITVKSLDQAFGSLYHDEIDIDSDDVVNLVAAATLLQLDCLVTQCAEVMMENIRLKYVVSYYISSEENGLSKVRDACLKWLCMNLLRCGLSMKLLKSISKELMINLISSNDLATYQGEIDVYCLLKRWIYIKCVSNKSKLLKNDSNLKADTDAWLLGFKGNKESFLETSFGQRFSPVFAAIRLHNILALERSVQLIIDDNIIPRSIIDKFMALKWQMQLCVEQDESKIACDEMMNKEIDAEFFYKSAIRCGRDIAQDIPINWRWTGYNHGIDVLISHKYRTISMQRNCTRVPCAYSANLKEERIFYYKLDATSVGRHRRIIWNASTGIQKAVMRPDAVKLIIRIPNFVNYPLTLSFWYSVIPINNKSPSIIDNYGQVWSEFLENSTASRSSCERSRRSSISENSLTADSPYNPETLDA